MIKIRKSRERGHFNFGWLTTYHTFSFGDYHDPLHMGFRTLRVINEDIVSPGQGFAEHGHREMEIITYIISGALAHRDNTGNAAVIQSGEVQRMSAGTGIRHSEFNHSKNLPVHLIQIWVLPDQHGLPPGYEQKTLAAGSEQNRLRLIASSKPSTDAVLVHQNIEIYDCALSSGSPIVFSLAPGRYAWLQIIHGEIQLDEYILEAGDGAAISKDRKLQIRAMSNSRFLLFDTV